MDQELKVKWIEALRSGEYKQTKGTLEVDGAFCCLGVLCKIKDLPHKHPMAVEDSNDTYKALEMVIGGDYGPLVEMNDKQGKSFSGIADWIEKNL